MMSGSRDTQELTSQEHKKYYQPHRGLSHGSDVVDKSELLSILRIIPSNDRAKLAFNEIMERKASGELNELHCQYLKKTGHGPLSEEIALPYNSDNEGELSDNSSDLMITYGHFQLDLKSETVSRVARWVIGKGSKPTSATDTEFFEVDRGVDILLAPTPSKYSRHIHPAHAYLNMHPDSGVLMISAGLGTSKGKGTEAKATVSLDKEAMLSTEHRCLTNAKHQLRIQGLQYSVEFIPDTFDKTRQYREAQDGFLKSQFVPIPRARISGIPLKTDISVTDLAIFNRGLAFGGYGHVYEGFCPTTGELRAVKEITLHSVNEDAHVRLELRITHTRSCTAARLVKFER